MNLNLRLCGSTLLLLATFPAAAFFDPTLGRWASRDPVGESGFSSSHEAILSKFNAPGFSAQGLRNRIFKEGEIVLYNFTQNHPAAAVDAFGLLTLDANNKRVGVGRCEIVVIYGHSSKDWHWIWDMSKGKGCNAGAAITCWPQSNSEGLSLNLVQSFAGDNDTEVYWGRPVGDADASGIIPPGAGGKRHDGVGLLNAKWLLMKAEIAASDQAGAFCKKPCCCPVVSVRFVRTRRADAPIVDPPYDPGSDYSDDAVVPDVQSYTVDCKSGKVEFRVSAPR